MASHRRNGQFECEQSRQSCAPELGNRSPATSLRPRACACQVDADRGNFAALDCVIAAKQLPE
jgi:hypothetical protein